MTKENIIYATVYTKERGKEFLTEYQYGIVSTAPGFTLHRTDGPAVELYTGAVAYYLDGKRVSKDVVAAYVPPIIEEPKSYILQVTESDSIKSWLNYSPGLWLLNEGWNDPEVDVINVEHLDHVDITKYKTVIFNLSKLSFWDSNPEKYNKMFSNCIKWHIRNDLHSHNLEIQKLHIRQASYVNFITSAYPLSIDENDIRNQLFATIVPFQANCSYREKLVRLPHAIPNSYQPCKTPLKDRIKQGLITGHQHTGIYPFRNGLKYVEDTVIFQHPGYKPLSYRHNIMHQDFINKLGEYVVSFADGGIVNYAVNKYIEVPYAGCILIAKYIPEVSVLGLKHQKNCFLVDTLDEVSAILKLVLKNPENYQEVANQGQKVILENHLSSFRWKTFKNLIRAAEKNESPSNKSFSWYDEDQMSGR